jgi:predicted HD superfamily hydrolase involved in NAD metabolism
MAASGKHDFISDDIRTKLKFLLTPQTYAHAEGVERIGIELAKRYGVDLKKAALACLLHDCAKDIDQKKQRKYMEKYGIKIDMKYPKMSAVFHGRVGAHMIGDQFKIKDREIINAVKNHTVGRKRMGTLEKIVYVADFIETGRRFPASKRLRKKFLNEKELTLDDLAAEVVREKIRYLVDNKHVINISAVEMWNEIVGADQV